MKVRAGRVAGAAYPAKKFAFGHIGTHGFGGHRTRFKVPIKPLRPIAVPYDDGIAGVVVKGATLVKITIGFVSDHTCRRSDDLYIVVGHFSPWETG